MLQERTELPPGILSLGSENLHRLLGGPTLIHLRGEREPPLFVSVLLHGNEPVGWEAVRALLAGYLERFGGLRLPRSLSLFIGNLPAAAAGVRHLPEQPDYNRVWPGSELPHTREHELMARVVERMAARGVFASVDIHNNTGRNPHYACVNRIESRFLQLATLFGRTVVYFLSPRGVQSMAMAVLCPAVTLECGKVGERHGVEHAREYLDACLHLSAIPEQPVAAHDIDLFHTVAQVKVADSVRFGFPPAEVPLQLNPEIERLNFRELPRGTALGRVESGAGLPVEARDERGLEVTERYFHVEDGELRLSLPVMPSMLTRDESVIRQDCLGYLMERYDDHLPPRV